MGKSTISTGPFSIVFCMFTRGYLVQWFVFLHSLQANPTWRHQDGELGANQSFAKSIDTGWWFQTFVIFHNIWDIILPNWLYNIYFSRWLKHVKTTNQYFFLLTSWRFMVWLSEIRLCHAYAYWNTWLCFKILSLQFTAKWPHVFRLVFSYNSVRKVAMWKASVFYSH